MGKLRFGDAIWSFEEFREEKKIRIRIWTPSESMLIFNEPTKTQKIIASQQVKGFKVLISYQPKNSIYKPY